MKAIGIRQKVKALLDCQSYPAGIYQGKPQTMRMLMELGYVMEVPYKHSKSAKAFVVTADGEKFMFAQGVKK